MIFTRFPTQAWTECWKLPPNAFRYVINVDVVGFPTLSHRIQHILKSRARKCGFYTLQHIVDLLDGNFETDFTDLDILNGQFRQRALNSGSSSSIELITIGLGRDTSARAGVLSASAVAAGWESTV